VRRNRLQSPGLGGFAVFPVYIQQLIDGRFTVPCGPAA
jgi:hypothetical protein